MTHIENVTPCGVFDLFSRLFRKLLYRISYYYVFSTSSHHSESNDMRQPYDQVTSMGNSIRVVFDDVITQYMDSGEGGSEN